MELHLEIGVIAEPTHAVFLFLPRLDLGLSFVVKLACHTFLSPSGLYLQRCCVAELADMN